MNTMARVCICCEGDSGYQIPLGSWSIAGVGEVGLAIRICARCGAVFQDPAPTPKVMERYYKNYSNYTNTARNGLPDKSLIDTVSKQVSIINKFLKPSRVFEVGCATGYMLSELKKIGWDVTGCDPSPATAQVSLDRWGIEIQTGFFEELSLDNECTDLVVFSHVLEHLYDPVLTLKRAHQILSESGHLLVEVPCLINPEKWPNGYFTFEHINIFSENILINCLAQAGFVAVNVEVSIDHSHYPVITILAKKSLPHVWCESQINSSIEVQSLINSHIKAESAEWERIDKLLNNELGGFDQVVIFGGGVHTSQLLANTKTLDTKIICSIIDSDPQKNGLELRGVKICSLNSIDLSGIEIAVVISSRASESEIYTMLSNQSNIGAKIIRLYE
jgi:SAM-dependent methyltransferase